MKLLTHEQMTKLTTKRLLAYKNSLLRVPERAVHIMYDTTQRICKDNPKWIKTYEDCKTILASREHVVRHVKLPKPIPATKENIGRVLLRNAEVDDVEVVDSILDTDHKPR